jgi:ABC-2 type transport system ATP-binding protein
VSDSPIPAPTANTADAPDSRHALAVETQALTRRFGDFTAVDGVTFQIRRGQIFGLLGPNGCGKTTTIRMLCGVLPPSGGRAIVLGHDVSRAAEAVKLQIGYMSQRAGLYDDLTPREHLRFYAGLYGLDGPARQAAIDAYLEESGLAPSADTIAAHLPGGQRQLLAFGCAVLHRPPLLFLDEPTAGIDPMARRRFWDDIHELALRGTTILVTTHFLEDAEYCHSLALMHRGRLVATGTPSGLKRSFAPKLLEVESPSPHEALDHLGALSGIQDAALYGTVLHLMLRPGVDPQDAARDIATTLEGAGVPATRVEPASPTLEDVFVAAIQD